MTIKTYNMTQILEHLKPLAIQAHYGTSFSPERRGETMISEFSEQLEADVKELEAAGVDTETVCGYAARYETFFRNYLHAKGRCISSMITGPARFPVRRAEKANRSEQRHYEVFVEWRGRAKRAIIRKLQPAKTISGELQKYRDQLAAAVKYQETMKEVNATFRKWKKNPDTDLSHLSEAMQQKLKNWVPQYSFEKAPFQTWQLTNNNANIKRLEGRVKEMERKEQLSETVKQNEFPFEGGRVVLNHEADRVQVFNDQKPPREKIDQMKRNGFKWSPSNGCWQRQLTGNGVYAANSVTGLQIRY